MFNINIKQQLRLFYHDERGSYVVSCALLSTVMVTMASFGLDGAHFLHQKARLSDALEQAALALTAEDSPETRGDNERHRQLATNYVRAYMPQLKALPSIKVTVRPSDDKQTKSAYVRYHVQAHNIHHSWILSDYYHTFTSSVNIGDNAVAQKNFAVGSYKKRDIVFVLDVSNSMNQFWCENENVTTLVKKLQEANVSDTEIKRKTGCIRKIERLKLDVMREFDTILRLNTNSRIAIVPFDVGVLYKEKCHIPFVMKPDYHPTLLIYPSEKSWALSFIKEEIITSYELSNYKEEYSYDSLSDLVDVRKTLQNKNKPFNIDPLNPSTNQLEFYTPGTIKEMMGVNYKDDAPNKTVFLNSDFDKLKEIKGLDKSIYSDQYTMLVNFGFHKQLIAKHQSKYEHSLVIGYFPKLFDRGCSGNSPRNEALLLTNDIHKLEKKIQDIGVGGNTIVLSGILFASQLLSENDKDTLKKIIFISDTEDNHLDFTNAFIRQGLCRDVNWQLSVIPISHKPKIEWNNCLLDPVTRKETKGEVNISIPAVEKPSEFAPILNKTIFGIEKVGHNVVKD